MKFSAQGLDESVHFRVTTAHPNHDKELTSETTASNERTSNTPESEKQDAPTLTGEREKDFVSCPVVWYCKIINIYI